MQNGLSHSSSLPSGPIIEFLIDIMYADIVLKDRCCRRVGDLFISQHESALQRIVTSGSLPGGLEKAINAYCIRQVLLRAPELIRTSREAVAALEALSEQITQQQQVVDADDGNDADAAGGDGDDEDRSKSALLHRAGCDIAKDLGLLRERLTTKRYARLIDSLGEAVVGYMFVASAQTTAMEEAQLHPGAPWTGVQAASRSYMQCIRNFVSVTEAYRSALKRQRSEAICATASELLAIPEDHEQQQQHTQHGNMVGDGARTPPPPRRRVEVDSVTSVTRTVRITASDPIEEAFHALADSTPVRQATRTQPDAEEADEDNSVIVVERSVEDLQLQLVAAEQPQRNGRRRVMVGASEASMLDLLHADGRQAAAAAAVGSERPWVPSGGVDVRSYFLSPQTGRFEPVVAQGFFDGDGSR